jgi:hypothetical protein
MGGATGELIVLDLLVGDSKDVLPPGVDVHCITFGKNGNGRDVLPPGVDVHCITVGKQGRPAPEETFTASSLVSRDTLPPGRRSLHHLW